MDVKKVTPFRRKTIKVVTNKNKIFVGRFIDYEDDEDVDVDTILLQNKELWFNELQSIPVPDILSIEVVENKRQIKRLN
ncbi:hypothetical protein [Pseudolactococcus insecticola]|uniref:Uncharacterized protein n=1 Tax=Pseudolactococcus insecticola TaxID=2709158 RepID=A0A6A0B5L0_9LACT|nr:hypothetical protein [Lactococcus insecticola]GFH40709.1 hypothetical protein Hs20B_11070 [Lactococcus insecticola]